MTFTGTTRAYGADAKMFRLSLHRGSQVAVESDPNQLKAVRLLRLLVLSLLVALVVLAQIVISSNYTRIFLAVASQETVSALPVLPKQDHIVESTIIPLPDLVDTNLETTCPDKDLTLISDVRLDSAIAYNRTIPRIVHVTSRSRCVHAKFQPTINAWKFPTYAFFFHNDKAVDRLLNKEWPEFPLIQQAVQCLRSGAGKIDLWRALVVWEYGGIYTDMDNAPNKFHGETISDLDESFFVVEHVGVLSQYFFAAAPKHPLMWHIVHTTMLRVYGLHDVDSQYVPYVTGPGALKHAFISFMQDQGPNDRTSKGKSKAHSSLFNRVTAGVYSGHNNRTVTVIGKKDHAEEYVKRNVVRRKDKLYEGMGMTHFGRMTKADENIPPESCVQRLHSNLYPSPNLMDIDAEARIDNTTDGLFW